MREINEIMREYAQYKRVADETTAIIDSLKNEMRDYLRSINEKAYIGNEHKIKVINRTNSYISWDKVKELLPTVNKSDISCETS